MISNWRILPIAIGDWVVSEVEAKFDVTFTPRLGWHMVAVIVEAYDGKPIRVERDGTVSLSRGKHLVSSMAMSIAASAATHFDEFRGEILDEMNLTESAA